MAENGWVTGVVTPISGVVGPYLDILDLELVFGPTLYPISIHLCFGSISILCCFFPRHLFDRVVAAEDWRFGFQDPSVWRFAGQLHLGKMEALKSPSTTPKMPLCFFRFSV